MNEGGKVLLAASAALSVAAIALRVFERVSIPGLVVVVVFLPVAVSQVVLVLRALNGAKDAKAEGLSATAFLVKPPAAVVAAGGVLAGVALILILWAFASLTQGSAGRAAHGCDFYQVNRGSVTCVDESQYLAARAAERSLGFAVAAGFFAAQAVAFASTRDVRGNVSPIWSPDSRSNDWV